MSRLKAVAAAAAVVAAVVSSGCGERVQPPVAPVAPTAPAAPGLFAMTFDGPSGKLKTTEVVPTLDTPIPKGKNAVWCASFVAAWKMLQGDLAGEPVRLDGADEVAARLNAAPDPRPHVPEGCLYAAAGFENKGILQTILRDMAARFPRKAPPQFPGIVPGSFVAYAYLEAGLKFTIPYFQNDKPLVFTAGDGAKTEINSFGIREKDDYAYRELRAQARVIYHEGGLDGPEARFAVDLCGKSEPSQVVVARIPRPADLLAAVESIERNLGRTGHGIGINDVLLVPDIFWRLSHRFAGLEGRRFGNKRLDGQRIDVAQQDILFRLDRSGAELASEAKTYMLPEPTHFTFDRPFLVYMKKRGEKMPYFAMWVDNAELLRKW